MELIAKDGMWLTQSHLENENERDFFKRIHLAYSLTEEDFTEVSDEYKAKWEQEHPEEEPEV